MLLLATTDFGSDGVMRGHISTVTTDTGLRPSVASGIYLLVLLDGNPSRAYVLCSDPATDTLNLAMAGPAS